MVILLSALKLSFFSPKVLTKRNKIQKKAGSKFEREILSTSIQVKLPSYITLTGQQK